MNIVHLIVMYLCVGVGVLGALRVKTLLKSIKFIKYTKSIII